MIDVCGLCERPAKLEMSHILPAFVFRWLKAAGPIRSIENVNLRVQDGLKFPLLCRPCEELLNTFETPFASQIFYPLDANPAHSVRYEEWMLKFCVSVSWRSLIYFKRRAGEFSHFSINQNLRASEALNVWREFLLGARPHPGAFEQHVLTLSEIDTSTDSKLPTNINRYLARTVDMDVAVGASNCFVYSKIGPVMVFGFIELGKPRWEGSRISPSKGRFGPGTFKLPWHLWDYLKSRAQIVQNASSNTSAVQRQKIDSSVLQNREKFLSSGLFRSMKRDIEMFGEEALTPLSRTNRAD